MPVSALSRFEFLRNRLLIGAALVALAAGAAVIAFDATPSSAGTSRVAAAPDAVYTTTNDPKGNAVVMFTRKANGKLVQRKTVKTGGTGIAAQPPFGFPIVDSSGSLELTPNGRLLFAVNDGDNTISSFLITASGPKLVDNVTSGGILPISITTSKGLLYVLNEESGNIFGYRYSKTGHLTPIAKSAEALSQVGPDGVAADIGFDPSGKVLVVTQRNLPSHNGIIDTFRVRGNGTTGPAQAHQANDANPFGFDFAGSHLLVANVGFVATPPNTAPNPGDLTQFTGTASSYDVTGSGGLTATGVVPSGGRAACWLVVTKDNKFAFVTNTLSSGPPPNIGTGTGGLSRYSVGADGKLTLLGQTDTGPGFPGDEALSKDSKFLYVLLPFVMGGPSHIDVYKVGSGGSLTHIQATPNTLPNGVSGIAAN
jgi:6-phosphogluconolactonase